MALAAVFLRAVFLDVFLRVVFLRTLFGLSAGLSTTDLTAVSESWFAEATGSAVGLGADSLTLLTTVEGMSSALGSLGLIGAAAFSAVVSTLSGCLTSGAGLALLAATGLVSGVAVVSGLLGSSRVS